MSWFSGIALKLVDGILTTPSKIALSVLWLFYGPGRDDFALGCIQSYDILASVKPSYAMINEKNFFLHKFSGVKDVSYLDREDVTLYCVTEDEFVFVRTSPEVDIFDTEKYPFVYNIQHTSAEELLTAPHQTVFNYLKGKPARDGCNIAFLHNPGRCGSTAVAAMMFKTKQCVVQSEPTPVLSLALMFNKKDFPASRKSTEYLELVRATFLLLCPDPETIYFIKPWGIQTLSLLPLLHQALPGIKEMFMLRSIRPTVFSFKGLGGSQKVFDFMGNMAISWLPVNYRNLWENKKRGHGDEAFCFLVLSQIHAYLQEVQDRSDIPSYSYESLKEDKEGFTRSLLADVGLGEEYLGAALSALEKDSQANSPSHNRGRTAGVERTSIPETVMEWAAELARNEFGIEMVGDEGRIVNMPHPWEKRGQ